MSTDEALENLAGHYHFDFRVESFQRDGGAPSIRFSVECRDGQGRLIDAGVKEVERPTDIGKATRELLAKIETETLRYLRMEASA